jgi:hypothetical protein
MRYRDEDRPEWGAEQRDFVAAWRRQPKWVVSRPLKSVGRNATLVANDVEAVRMEMVGYARANPPYGPDDHRVSASLLP